MDSGYIDRAMAERRSLEQALAALRDKYKKEPSAALARSIQLLEDELRLRRGTRDAGKSD